jgi:hypothetical protein
MIFDPGAAWRKLRAILTAHGKTLTSEQDLLQERFQERHYSVVELAEMWSLKPRQSPEDSLPWGNLDAYSHSQVAGPNS